MAFVFVSFTAFSYIILLFIFPFKYLLYKIFDLNTFLYIIFTAVLALQNSFFCSFHIMVKWDTMFLRFPGFISLSLL